MPQESGKKGKHERKKKGKEKDMEMLKLVEEGKAIPQSDPDGDEQNTENEMVSA